MPGHTNYEELLLWLHERRGQTGYCLTALHCAALHCRDRLGGGAGGGAAPTLARDGTVTLARGRTRTIVQSEAKQVGEHFVESSRNSLM